MKTKSEIIRKYAEENGIPCIEVPLPPEFRFILRLNGIPEAKYRCSYCGYELRETWYDAQRDEMRGQCELLCLEEVKAIEK